MPEALPSLLLLIPAYNEEQRIGPVLRDYAAYFQKNFPGKFQLVVILNGCRDRTLDVVREAGREFSAISALDFAEPIGKGGALIEGLKLAPLADLIGYVDADGATGPASFHDLVKQLAATGADCVVGSRWIEGAVLHQAQTGRRRFASRCFHAIVQGLFWMSIRDTQCGAKVIKREAIEKIHGQLRIADMAFDINLLYSLLRAGFRVREVPTEWTDKTGSKVALGRTSFTMLLSVIRLRLVYSPLRPVLKFFAPLDSWIYRKMRAPVPRRGRE
ncbi:MAG: glycosyltransferase [Verrucomicrobia bacterium]|nr:glycosyltransferase [Verrucomicrobiota bacterium]